MQTPESASAIKPQRDDEFDDSKPGSKQPALPGEGSHKMNLMATVTTMKPMLTNQPGFAGDGDFDETPTA